MSDRIGRPAFDPAPIPPEPGARFPELTVEIPMPLLMCPNDDAPMQTMERSGVQFDMCPTCRGVWLDRGELEKLMTSATDEGRAAAAQPPQAQPPQQQHSAPSPWGGNDSRDDRHRGYGGDDNRYRKKKRDSIFDIFD